MQANNDPTIASLINLQEFEKVAKTQMSNIVAAGLTMGLISWYQNDLSDHVYKKVAVSMAGQFAGSTLVDMLYKSGKIEDPNGNVGKGIEVVAASGFYSLFALKGLQIPDYHSRKYQEAVVSSLGGIFGGQFLAEQLVVSK